MGYYLGITLSKVNKFSFFVFLSLRQRGMLTIYRVRTNSLNVLSRYRLFDRNLVNILISMYI